ncbi:hypothetical protein N658DRAFT_220341 [Parathielavia hyrcaniae]|uniref:Uncharacterized protein n=1 Tax=Parathielavia hyrcaniae TaxID=113614 RepID=A0AAN6PVG3_9PEZI|nr:hypothetical protein N658DRAFT_220341 [Parathielavia hyrcaniae]
MAPFVPHHVHSMQGNFFGQCRHKFGIYRKKKRTESGVALAGRKRSKTRRRGWVTRRVRRMAGYFLPCAAHRSPRAVLPTRRRRRNPAAGLGLVVGPEESGVSVRRVVNSRGHEHEAGRRRRVPPPARKPGGHEAGSLPNPVPRARTVVHACRHVPTNTPVHSRVTPEGAMRRHCQHVNVQKKTRLPENRDDGDKRGRSFFAPSAVMHESESVDGLNRAQRWFGEGAYPARDVGKVFGYDVVLLDRVVGRESNSTDGRVRGCGGRTGRNVRRGET